MTELIFSVMNYGPVTTEALQPLLQEFEQQSGVKVGLRLMEWDTGRYELSQIAIHHQGPDVSEIGQTWLSDLISMATLRPFYRSNLEKIGKKEEFLPVSWVNCTIPDDPTIWAVPWITDVFNIHYRKDLLQKAGIPEANAFQSYPAIDHTVEQLNLSGVQVPIGLPLSFDRQTNLHVAASWIWGAGGEFCTTDGKRVLFDQPQAVRGIVGYYRLLRHLSPEALRICHSQNYVELFHAGQAAVIFAPHSATLPSTLLLPEVRQNWGIAPFPNASWTGGSNLIIWKHSRQERAALELVDFMTSSSFQSRFPPALGVLPCRIAAYASPGLKDDPVLQIQMQSLLSARTYTTFPLWGIVEDRLVQALQNIWEEYYANPSLDLEELVSRVIRAIAGRLNITLSQYRTS